MCNASFMGATTSSMPVSVSLLNAPHVQTTHALQPVKHVHANEDQLCTRRD